MRSIFATERANRPEQLRFYYYSLDAVSQITLSILGHVGAELAIAVPIIPPADGSSLALGAASRWLINCSACTQIANPVEQMLCV